MLGDEGLKIYRWGRDAWRERRRRWRILLRVRENRADAVPAANDVLAGSGSARNARKPDYFRQMMCIADGAAMYLSQNPSPRLFSGSGGTRNGSMVHEVNPAVRNASWYVSHDHQ